MITKVIPMPADLDENDMEAQIELEAVNYIPYPIEEVNLDFEVIGSIPNNPEMVPGAAPRRVRRMSSCASPHWSSVACRPR